MNEWGYVDPVQRVHEQRMLRAMSQPVVQPDYQVTGTRTFPLPQPMGPQIGSYGTQEILYNGAPAYRPAQPSVAGAIVGAAIGTWLYRKFSRRNAQADRTSEAANRYPLS